MLVDETMISVSHSAFLDRVSLRNLWPFLHFLYIFIKQTSNHKTDKVENPSKVLSEYLKSRHSQMSVTRLCSVTTVCIIKHEPLALILKHFHQFKMLNDAAVVQAFSLQKQSMHETVNLPHE